MKRKIEERKRKSKSINHRDRKDLKQRSQRSEMNGFTLRALQFFVFFAVKGFQNSK